MSGTQLFHLALSIALTGLILAGSIYFFGQYLYDKWCVEPLERRCFQNYEHFLHELANNRIASDRIRAAFSDPYESYLERRNELWTFFGQVVLAILLLTLITILLLLEVISPDAGLPILSAVAGFAMGRGIGPGKGPNLGGPPQEELSSQEASE